MKIFDLSYFNTNPPIYGGKMRIYSFNRVLSRHKDVCVEQYSFNPRFFTKQKTFSFNHNHYKEFVFSQFIYSFFVALLALLGMVVVYPFFVTYIFKFVRPPQKILNGLEKADIIQVELPWLVSWIKRYTDKPIILVAHNVEYEVNKSIFGHKLKLYPQIIKNKILNEIKKVEEKAMNLADMIFCVSGDDKKKIISLYNLDVKKVVIIPNGINIEDYSIIPEQDKQRIKRKLGLGSYKKIILFVGAVYSPNMVAANIIKSSIAPTFKKEKNILFVIAGSVCKKKLKDNIFCTGPLSHDEILDYLKISDIAINPITYGGGSSIKMFEYLAAGLPLVTTEKGRRGISKSVRKAFIISPINKFSENIKKLLYSKQKTKEMRKKSLELAREYDYLKITKKAISQYNRLIKKDY